MLKKQAIHTPMLDSIMEKCKEENRKPTTYEYRDIGVEHTKNFIEKVKNVFRKA